MKNKVFSYILILFIFTSLFQPIFAESNTITIASKNDFEKFSKNCTLDTWSRGKTVNLACDISLENKDFSPIPTFGGVFNGNGHTISGIKLSKNGSYLGLFRYIQNGAKVSNLNINGTFTPGGSKSFIGGIAGENSGTIEDCSFEGSIKGENVIGGITGNNSETGKIVSCTSSGTIQGENSTGGISGKNSGLIQKCTNNAKVNTVYEEKKKELGDINVDAGAMVESYKTQMEENSEESILGHTDTGGIAGFSSGIIQGCINSAPIGYKHIGYNVGGIAGRQSGYLLGCKNFGLIQGRKDTGGIVGQMEPYIKLELSETSLKNIRTELNHLNKMVNTLLTDTDSLTDKAEQHLDKISKQSKSAQDNAKVLIDDGRDFINDNLDEINTQAAIISNTLDKLEPVFKNLETGFDDMGDALDSVSDALDKLEISFPDLSGDINEIDSAIDDMVKAERKVKKAVSELRDASEDLGKGIRISNKAQVKKAVSDLGTAIEDIIIAKKASKKALTQIEEILSEKPESFEALGIKASEIAENIKNIKNNTDKTISALNTITESLDTIILNTEIDLPALKEAFIGLDSAFSNLGSAAHYMINVLDDLGDALKPAADKLNDFSNNTSSQLNDSKDSLSDAVDSMTYACDDIKASINELSGIISDLSEEEPPEFVKLSEASKTAGDNLFNSLTNISDELEGLKNTLSDGGDIIKGDFEAISNQFNLIMNLILDELEEFKLKESISDVFDDISDEDIEGTTKGKVKDCQNSGKVEADRNSGGIAGAMAIEYSKDPEDDIEKPDALNFTYRTKAVLQSCINDGEITGKKDCTGGIVGLAEIGTVYACENYADIESADGYYTGGIAGKSESVIRKCYSKCTLNGKRHIGGIVGKGEAISGCYSISSVKGDEYTGAICGNAGSREKIYKCRFIDKGLGGIDGISYSDIAEPISFEELKSTDSVPTRFVSFTVSFYADEKLIDTCAIKYGDPTARIKYPEIPEKDGHFGVWQEPEAKTVTEDLKIICEYKPYITLLASIEKNKNGKLALALAEGEFTDKAELHIAKGNQAPPKKTAGRTVVYDISLSNTDIKDSDTVSIRILNENKDKVKAWRLDGDRWEAIKTKTRGKYTVLNTNGTNHTVCLQYTKKSNIFVYPTVIALLAAACIGFIKIKKKFIK